MVGISQNQRKPFHLTTVHKIANLGVVQIYWCHGFARDFDRFPGRTHHEFGIQCKNLIHAQPNLREQYGVEIRVFDPDIIDARIKVRQAIGARFVSLHPAGSTRSEIQRGNLCIGYGRTGAIGHRAPDRACLGAQRRRQAQNYEQGHEYGFPAHHRKLPAGILIGSDVSARELFAPAIVPLMFRRIHQKFSEASESRAQLRVHWTKTGSSSGRKRRPGMVPGARIELATPAFSGRRSTNELPRHKQFRNCRGDVESCQFGEKNSANQCAESSNSFIQLRFFSTSRGLVPSGGPTMPSFSMRSIRRAARP